jgi:hypothetical protein
MDGTILGIIEGVSDGTMLGFIDGALLQRLHNIPTPGQN